MNQPTDIRIENLPEAIWMPSPWDPGLPCCYQGTPLEMVRQMADEMRPGMGVNDTIDLLLRTLVDERQLRIELNLPNGTDERTRSSMFVCALLFSGVAEEMPQA